MRQKIELLAPAGSREALEAVLGAGADAVYFSEKRFAMRQHGAWLNFEQEELGEIVAYIHEHGAKAYITLNNLLTAEELAVLPQYLRYLQSIQPDALIIQDLGLLRLVREMKLDIALHASTMMNVHSAHAAGFLRDHGISRVITSRDITIYEARDIARNSGVEVEYFVHGDMCVAQSAQCLHSGIATDLSANRGKCLKSCRWQWSLTDRETNKILAGVDEQYVLARKDLCLYHQIPELIAAGIASLKIEGRARPADHLRPIVEIYRAAIDRYYDDPAVYSTDFEALSHLRRATVREIGTSHAFSTPGVGSSGLSGKREPRFFSIAVEERPYDGAGRPGPGLNGGRHQRPQLSVRCMTGETARALLRSACDWIYVGGEHFSRVQDEGWRTGELAEFVRMCRTHGKKVGLVTPRITTDREFAEIAHLVDALSAAPPDEYLVGNVGAFAYLSRLTDVPLHGDFSLNLWNPAAVEVLRTRGMTVFTPGLELDLAGLRTIGQNTDIPMECMIHGSMPGMLLEHCVIGTHMSRTGKHDPCPGPCTKRNYALTDKLGQLHWLATDQYCRNHLFMVKDLCTVNRLAELIGSGCRRMRIEGPLYEPTYLLKLVDIYARAIAGCVGEAHDDPKALLNEITNGMPRPLTAGAYDNVTESISQPCRELPTDVMIRYPASPFPAPECVAKPGLEPYAGALVNQPAPGTAGAITGRRCLLPDPCGD